ncbi:MAG: hypothetical protein ACI9LM_005118 [Alteromonadaceae bacterium]
MLLAEIIEIISEQRFEDYMINNFFIQNRMLNSYIADEFLFSNSTDALNYAESSQLWGINIYTNGSDGQI